MGPCGHVSHAQKGAHSTGAYKCDKWWCIKLNHLTKNPCANLHVEKGHMVGALKPGAGAKPQPGRTPIAILNKFKYICLHIYNKQQRVAR
jgi:hypothetical protein